MKLVNANASTNAQFLLLPTPKRLRNIATPSLVNTQKITKYLVPRLSDRNWKVIVHLDAPWKLHHATSRRSRNVSFAYSLKVSSRGGKWGSVVVINDFSSQMIASLAFTGIPSLPLAKIQPRRYASAFDPWHAAKCQIHHSHYR